jgi:poly(3-hydroxybutyrate) depolymerase
MKSAKRVLGAIFILISLPVVLALSEALSFHARNRNNGSIVSSGQKREYLLYVPLSYDPWSCTRRESRPPAPGSGTWAEGPAS